jgi:hypothetical protein
MPEGFALVTPMHREMTARTAWCIEAAHQTQLPFVWYPHPGDALIGRARSIIATHFLEKMPYDYLIMLDSDIVFTPNDLAKLYKDLVDGYELIGGVYTVRHAEQLAHYGIKGKIFLDNTICEVSYLSTGFMGISKALLQKMVDELKLPICHPQATMFRCYPFFENTAWFFEETQEWIYRSEDWDFCDKAARVGVKPMLDTSIRLGHEGTKTWTCDDLPENKTKPIESKLILPNAVRVNPNKLVSARKR